MESAGIPAGITDMITANPAAMLEVLTCFSFL